MKFLTQCDNEVLVAEYSAALEDNGIACIVQRENPIYPLGGVQVQITILVDEDKIEDAQRIINAIDAKREEQLPWCPSCGSENVVIDKVVNRRHAPGWVLIIALVVAVIAIIVNIVVGGVFILALVFFWFKSYKEKLYHCNNCGNNFKK